MTVYVDDANISFRGEKWCHLLADSLNELHSFANSLNIDKCWFHRDASYPHYDISSTIRLIAIKKGAIPADRKTIIKSAKKLKTELNYEDILSGNLKQIELF